MKSLITFFLPLAILLAVCSANHAHWMYFIFSVPVGLIFGFLFTVTMFWILGTKRRNIDLKKTWNDEK